MSDESRQAIIANASCLPARKAISWRGLTSHGNFSPALVPIQPPIYFTLNTRFTLA